jgi:alkyl hydroperoxide reductase subunit F
LCGATIAPSVYATGDVTRVPFKQIIVAGGAGAKAALGAFDHPMRTAVPTPPVAV